MLVPEGRRGRIFLPATKKTPKMPTVTKLMDDVPKKIKVQWKQPAPAKVSKKAPPKVVKKQEQEDGKKGDKEELPE
jgi:hypothetical protein